MAKYKLAEHKNGDKREVCIIKERIHFRLGPLIVCFLMAALVWLYITGKKMEVPGHPDGTETNKTVGSAQVITMGLDDERVNQNRLEIGIE